MGKGLQRVLKVSGEMKISANGKTVVWVWDYALGKARIKSEMTKEEFMASEKAKWMPAKPQENDTPTK